MGNNFMLFKNKSTSNVHDNRDNNKDMMNLTLKS